MAMWDYDNDTRGSTGSPQWTFSAAFWWMQREGCAVRTSIAWIQPRVILPPRLPTVVQSDEPPECSGSTWGVRTTSASCRPPGLRACAGGTRRALRKRTVGSTSLRSRMRVVPVSPFDPPRVTPPKGARFVT